MSFPPRHPSAQKIDPTLPNVLLLHPVYFGQVIFHAQFSDVRLRRFNLIAPDMRGQGETGGHVNPHWTCEDAANDIVAFMDALKLPPCHLFGASMGSCVALQVAMTYLERALSAFLVSPLSDKEEQENVQGRREILNTWIETFGGAEDSSRWDPELMEHAEYGALQLAYNNLKNTLVDVIHRYTTPQLVTIFGPGKFGTPHTVTVEFFVDLHQPTPEQLRRIRCQVLLVFCGGDVAYTIESSEEIRNALRGTDVDAELVSIEHAPRFGVVTHADKINELFHDFVMGHTDFLVPSPPACAVSPFYDQLRNLGWIPEEERKSESIESVHET